MKANKRPLYGENRCLICGKTCRQTFYTFAVGKRVIDLHLKCHDALYREMVYQEAQEKRVGSLIKQICSKCGTLAQGTMCRECWFREDDVT